MQQIPTMGSHRVVFLIFLKMLIHISRNVFPLAFIPKISFTWDVKIISATADVKPEDTGPDTKSIIKPKAKNNMFFTILSN